MLTTKLEKSYGPTTGFSAVYTCLAAIITHKINAKDVYGNAALNKKRFFQLPHCVINWKQLGSCFRCYPVFATHLSSCIGSWCLKGESPLFGVVWMDTTGVNKKQQKKIHIVRFSSCCNTEKLFPSLKNNCKNKMNS